MSHSVDWRCDACERPDEHDFPAEPTGAAGAGTAARADGTSPVHTLTCGHCGHSQPMAAAAFDETGRLRDPVDVCIACGGKRLYSQKDFNRKLGVAIVVVGAVLSPWTYGLSLVACMGIDYGLYYVVPEITVCYGCDAIHRGFEHNPAHRAHDPLLAERFRRESRQELGLEAPDDATADARAAESRPFDSNRGVQ
ncbi:MAG TPA: hypothetical protein VGD06_11400 [Acidobacteriota bacterium]